MKMIVFLHDEMCKSAVTYSNTILLYHHSRRLGGHSGAGSSSSFVGSVLLRVELAAGYKTSSVTYFVRYSVRSLGLRCDDEK